MSKTQTLAQGVLIGLCLLSTCHLFSQYGYFFGAGGRATGLGGSALLLEGPEALFSNQAGLASISSPAGSVVAENRFMLQELNLYGGALALPTRYGNLGISVQQFGIKQIREQKIGLAYAHMLTEGLSVGGQVNWLNTSIQEYGSISMVTFEFGIQSQILDKVKVGAHIYNPIRASRHSDGNYKTPTVLRLGMTYQPNDKLLWALEVEKNMWMPTRLRTGLEYHFIDPVYFRAGVATNPSTVYMGLGYEVSKQFSIDAACSYHTVLGITPSINVTYNFKDRKRNNPAPNFALLQ